MASQDQIASGEDFATLAGRFVHSIQTRGLGKMMNSTIISIFAQSERDFANKGSLPSDGL
jgi:hypothetical protein